MYLILLKKDVNIKGENYKICYIFLFNYLVNKCLDSIDFIILLLVYCLF